MTKPAKHDLRVVHDAAREQELHIRQRLHFAVTGIARQPASPLDCLQMLRRQVAALGNPAVTTSPASLAATLLNVGAWAIAYNRDAIDAFLTPELVAEQSSVDELIDMALMAAKGDAARLPVIDSVDTALLRMAAACDAMEHNLRFGDPPLSLSHAVDIVTIAVRALRDLGCLMSRAPS